MEKEVTTGSEILSLNAIRVETALSRYPVHRLARKGDIHIEVCEGSREAALRWKVSHNSEYGQPGPLAYKLDTLIINRRIEEAYRPIPRLIKLGSLHDICKELGVSEGKNKTTIKNALYQNASSFITAKIHYKSADGAERVLEAGFTRYNVIFTGEKLPDGRKADGVYIILNDVFIQVINGAMTRPLDYDYLKSLPPAPQRFYELLSYQMYAALKHDRPRARLNYSDFCDHAPQTRHLEWDRVRSQMNKLHRPHKQSGYIGTIDYEQTIDREGKADWIMLYQPGPKARAEFKMFNKRGGPTVVEIEPLMAPQANTLSFDDIVIAQPSPIERDLVDRGVTQTVATELVQQHGDEKIRTQIEVFDWLREIKDKKVSRSPAGYLVKSITTGENGYAVPEGFVSKAERLKREESKREKERQAAEARLRKEQAEAREQQERELITVYWNGLETVEQDRLMADAIAQADPDMLALIKGPTRKFGMQIVRERHIRTLLEVEGKLVPAEE